MIKIGARFMCSTKLKSALAIGLMFALLHAQIAPGFARGKPKKPVVAFAGIRFQGLTTEQQNKLLGRVLEIMESESALQLIKPQEARKTLGAEKVAAFLEVQDSSSYRALAGELQADHVFAGRIDGQTRESNRTLLVGELRRFDAKTNFLHTFEILKYEDNIGVEMVKFEAEYVKTLVQTSEGRGKIGPWLVLGGVTLIGLLAMTLAFTNAGGEGSGGGNGGDTP
jgi:hypothetical protein